MERQLWPTTTFGPIKANKCVTIGTLNIQTQAKRKLRNVDNHDGVRKMLSRNGYLVSSVIFVVPITRIKVLLYYSVCVHTEFKSKVTL